LSKSIEKFFRVRSGVIGGIKENKILYPVVFLDFVDMMHDKTFWNFPADLFSHDFSMRVKISRSSCWRLSDASFVCMKAITRAIVFLGVFLLLVLELFTAPNAKRRYFKALPRVVAFLGAEKLCSKIDAPSLNIEKIVARQTFDVFASSRFVSHLGGLNTQRA
jgi:hypothetical protein